MKTEKMISEAEAYKVSDLNQLRGRLTETEYEKALSRTNEALFCGEGLTLMEAMQDELAEKIRTLAER